MFHIVLLEPEIPANTGNIGRTCLVTGSHLHLIEPMGFILNDRNLKRAGMDYWKDVQVTRYDSWRDFVWKNAQLLDFPEETLRSSGYPGPAMSAVSEEENPVCASGQKACLSGQTVCASGQKARIWMATTKARKTHDQADFRDGDYLLFGKESAGIPEEILLENRETCIRIPMAHEQRSLNLSNSAAIVLYEALRQNHYPGLELAGNLHHHSW